MKNTLRNYLLAPVTCALCVGSAFASSIKYGDLVVTRVGTGAASLGSGSTAAFLEEFKTDGTPVQTIVLPTAASGSNEPLTLSGSATSEGFLAISTNHKYLTLGGYDTAPGTASVATSASTTINRVVGRVAISTGGIDTTTHLDDAFNGSNIRSAVSTDGTDLWIAGNGGSGLGDSAGVKYTTLGATTGSLRLNDGGSNMRMVDIYNNQLYVSSSTGTFQGINTVGTGVPTTGFKTNTLAGLPGFPTTVTHSNYDFWFKDASTLYVADDGSAANGGGIQKWTLTSGTWSLIYTLLNNGSTTTAVRGLTGTVDGLGNAVLFGTTTQSSANNLITLTDTGSGATASILATAGASTAFRGVEYIVPEPASLVMMSLAGLALLGLRRRR